MNKSNELFEAKNEEAMNMANELSETKIEEALSTEIIGKKIILLPEIDSTNRYAKAIARKEIDGYNEKSAGFGREIGGYNEKSAGCGREIDGCAKEPDGCSKEIDGYDKKTNVLVEKTNVNGEEIERCKKGIDEGIDGCVVIARSQQAGYGRDGQQWFTGSGNDIAMSAIVCFEDDAKNLGDLSMLVSLAIRRAILKICDVETAIKWPNDLMIDGKKCCGILCETASSGNKISYIIIGIGLNVNSMQFDDTIDHRACSLRQACGVKTDLNMLIANILNQLEQTLYGAWRRNERSALHEQYQRFSNLVGKEIKIVRKQHGFDISVEARGTVRGFEPDGSIRLELDDGSIKRIYSGELSLIE